MILRQAVKNGYFTVRLTVSVYPPPLYGQLFVIFIGVSLIKDYDYMGQIPQDGNVGQNVVLFKKKSRAFV